MAIDFSKIKITQIPYDHISNKNNPYDHLSYEERVTKINKILAEIALRNIDKFKVNDMPEDKESSKTFNF